MTDRRSFLALLGSLVAAPLVAMGFARDDSAYLQGLINAGKVVPAGSYHLTRTLIVPKGRSLVVSGIGRICITGSANPLIYSRCQ